MLVEKLTITLKVAMEVLQARSKICFHEMVILPLILTQSVTLMSHAHLYDFHNLNEWQVGHTPDKGQVLLRYVPMLLCLAA